MADTMVERLTGQTAAADVNVELQIMMSLEALLDPKSPKASHNPGLWLAACRYCPRHCDHQPGT